MRLGIQFPSGSLMWWLNNCILCRQWSISFTMVLYRGIIQNIPKIISPAISIHRIIWFMLNISVIQYFWFWSWNMEEKKHSIFCEVQSSLTSVFAKKWKCSNLFLKDAKLTPSHLISKLMKSIFKKITYKGSLSNKWINQHASMHHQIILSQIIKHLAKAINESFSHKASSKAEIF